MKLHLPTIFERASRYYVFIFLNVYGLGKIAGGQFYRKGSLPEAVAETTLAQASAFDITWTFMGYSYTYILFIGITQLLGAWMLLFERSKLIGTLILLPVMVNVVVFDSIFLDKKGALVNASIYLFMLLYILWFNKEKVISAVQSLTAKLEVPKRSTKEVILRLAVVGGLMTLIFVVDQFFVRMLGN
jgi:hypothetical protein